MKLNVFHVLSLCICLGQICFGMEGFMEDQMTNATIEGVRDAIPGVSDQFVNDFMLMYETYPDVVNRKAFLKLLNWLSKTIPKDENGKIDANQINNWNYTILFNDHDYVEDYEEYVKENAKYFFDETKFASTFFSKKLPSERYNGIMNLEYLIMNPNATTEETNIVMNYLYGNDTTARKVSFFDKVPELTSKDCPEIVQKHSGIIDKLKTMVDIKLKVIQDFTTTLDKFPCTEVVLHPHYTILNLLTRIDGMKSKITACKIKEYLDGSTDNLSIGLREFLVQLPEIILSARLSDEVYRGAIDFDRATFPNTSTEEIEKSLEYLYDDVPKSNCSIAENLKPEN